KLWIPLYLHEKLENSDNWSELIEMLKDNEYSFINNKDITETSFKNKNKFEYNNNKFEFNKNLNKNILLQKFTDSNNDVSPYVILEGKVKYTAILDKGAYISLISSDVFKNKNLVLKCNGILIKQAVGNFKTIGSVLLKIKHGGKKIHELPFHVDENLHSEIILGIDNFKYLKIEAFINKKIEILSVSKANNLERFFEFFS
ncbi:hypothetical protein DMUE_4338, partial [Dictyocoela muelleri]